MSLQIWLPLTKDLRQQGLSNVTVTNNGATFNSAGKLGGCYSFAKNAYIDIPASSMASFTNGASVSFWIKINSWNTNWDTIFQAGLGTTPWTSYTFGILRNQANYLCFCISNGSSYTSSSCKTGDLTLGQWYHLTMAYKTGHVLCYVNGSLVQDFATSIVPNFSSITSIKLGGLVNNYKCDCLLNDVRIYDHCLSSMEVKELAKGLVLHYPLNRGGWGQENLLLNTQVLTPNSSTTTKNCSQRGSAARQLRTDGFYEAKCTSAWQGLSTWANAQNLVVGQKYTYSFYFYTNGSTKSLSFYPMMYNSSGTRDTSSTLPISVDGSTYQNANARAFGAFSNTIPIRHYVTFEWNSTMASIISNGGTIELSIQVHGTFNSGEYGCVYAPKLEIGDKMTPWCPNLSDALATIMGLNSTTEYDCSGFCNNGTRTGTFTWTSNTAKYAVSTKFNGTDNAIQTPSLPTMIADKNYTIAVWIYKTVIGSKGYQTIYGGPSGFEIEARNGSANETKFVPWNWGKPMASYELNEWNHCVFVHSDADCKIYLNGEYIATGTAKASNPTGNYFVGAWNTATQQNFDGLMSDFRIYATALSPSDVKSLYQNCATIDPDGTIRGQIRS